MFFLIFFSPVKNPVPRVFWSRNLGFNPRIGIISENIAKF
jgi:hypothetical protein